MKKQKRKVIITNGKMYQDGPVWASDRHRASVHFDGFWVRLFALCIGGKVTEY